MRERQDRPAAKKFFQAVGLLALALVSVYIIVQCFVIFRQSYKTETAIRYTMAESVRLSGVVAFDSVDVAGSGNLGYLVQDGERVTNGTVVAECYTNDEQGVQRERLDRLARTITLLTKSQNSTGSELSVLTNQTRQSLYNLLDKLDTAQYSGISEAEDNFLLAQNRLQISTGQTAGFSQTIAALQEEYDGLKSQLDTLQTITAATNGYFSSTAASPSIRADRQALEEQRSQLESRQTELNSQLEAATQLIAKYNETADGLNDLAAQEKAAADELDAQIQARREEENRNNGGDNSGGSGGGGGSGSDETPSSDGYIWPSDCRLITSGYGGREQPTPGASTTHMGVDIGASYGSYIYAVKSGTVVGSKYSWGGYGNYVEIDHGNGNFTLYAHMSERLVEVGEYVEQGEVIGLCGSTGISTGPHVHYEIWENYTRINPLNRLPGYIPYWW